MIKKWGSLALGGLFLTTLTFNSTLACNSGEECFKKGYQEYSKGNYKKAIEYGKKSCDTYGYSKGCFGLGYLYEHGEGLPKDMDKALEYYKKSLKPNTNLCNQNDGQACFELGYLYKNGFAVKKDVKKALELFKKSCNLKYPKGCQALKK